MENETQTSEVETENTSSEQIDSSAEETTTEAMAEETTEVEASETAVKSVSGSPLEPSKKLEGIELQQSKMSTPFILLFLFVVFFVLKSFIYTKDDKRHGK